MIGDNATKGTVIGGTCVNVGCMPSKRLITVGTLYHNRNSNTFEGIEYGRGKLDFRKIVKEKDRLVRKFRREKYSDVLKNLERVKYYPANGKLVSQGEVEAGTETLRADKIIIATGARPNIPTIEGTDQIDYLTNEEALSLKELPRSLCVIGDARSDSNLLRCTHSLAQRSRFCKEAGEFYRSMSQRSQMS